MQQDTGKEFFKVGPETLLRPAALVFGPIAGAIVGGTLGLYQISTKHRQRVKFFLLLPELLVVVLVVGIVWIQLRQTYYGYLFFW